MDFYLKSSERPLKNREVTRQTGVSGRPLRLLCIGRKRGTNIRNEGWERGVEKSTEFGNRMKAQKKKRAPFCSLG